MAEEEKKEEAKQEEEKTTSEAKAQVHAEAAENWLAEFFLFKMFITRPFIKIIYVIGAAAITLLGLGSIFGLIMDFSSYSVIMGLVTLTLGNIAWRITCEIWIVFFRMHDIVKSIDNSLKEE